MLLKFVFLRNYHASNVTEDSLNLTTWVQAYTEEAVPWLNVVLKLKDDTPFYNTTTFTFSFKLSPFT